MTGRVLVWGAGAIGGPLGAAFLRAGRQVAFVDRDAEHVAAIARDGLRITGPLRQETARAPALLPHQVTGQHDLIILAVKAHHTEEAAADLAPHLAAGGAVLSAQNGLNELLLARMLGPERVLGCFVNFGADVTAPGQILLGGRGAVVVGEPDGSLSPRITDVHALMRAFEPEAVLTRNIFGYLWGKMIYGALLFATALTDDSIADVLAAAEARAVLTALGREIGAVAAAEGVRTEGFDGFDPAAFAPGAPAALTEKSFADMVAHNRRSAKTHSGIWRDLAVRKRPTEVRGILGAAVAAAEARGVPVPLTARVITLIGEIEAGRRSLSRDNLRALGEAA